MPSDGGSRRAELDLVQHHRASVNAYLFSGTIQPPTGSMALASPSTKRTT